MTGRIERLELDAFRGSTKPFALALDAGKPVVFVFGENGSGKSTIVDAIEFVCNESLGSCARSSLEPATHLPALNRNKKEMRVAITMSGGVKWSGSLVSARPKANGRPAGVRVRVLRRDTLQKVVSAPPADGYKQLRALIELRAVEAAEASLRTVCTDRAERFQQATVLTVEATERLDVLWKEAGAPPEGASAWAASIGEPASAQLRLDHLELLSTRLTTAASHAQSAQDATTGLEIARQDLSVAQAESRHRADIEATAARELSDLLSAALPWLDLHPAPEACPLCESVDGIADLKNRVAVRGQALAEVRQAAEKEQRIRERVISLQGAQEQTARALLAAVRPLRASLQDSKTLPSGQPIEWTDWTELAEAGESPELCDKAARLWKALSGEAPSVDAERTRLVRSLREQQEVRRARSTITQKHEEARALEGVSKRLKALLDIVEGERKAFVDQVLSDVSASFNSLYAAVHPGENLGDLRVFLDPSRQGSIKFDSTFEGKTGVPPQAYFSESHLDTLGICLFLALARCEPDSVVVLDDVLSSVDGPHATRLLALVLSEAKQFAQVILTTHYRFLYDGLLRTPLDKVHVIELGKWSIDEGLRSATAIPRTDELAVALKSLPFARHTVASKAGTFLEEILYNITRILRLRVPHKDRAGLDIRDLKQGLTKGLKPDLRIEIKKDSSTLSIGERLASLADRSWLRNRVGGHYSQPGLEIPDGDVRSFGQDILDIAQALFCPDCSEAPGRNRSGSYFECSCGDRRLYPICEKGQPPPPPETGV